MPPASFTWVVAAFILAVLAAATHALALQPTDGMVVAVGRPHLKPLRQPADTAQPTRDAAQRHSQLVGRYA